jgi:hypothetical protein
MAAVGLAAALLPGSGSALAQAAPGNTTEPRISGEPADGRLLTASPGTWSGTTPISFAYRWLRCGTDGGAADGSNCLVIGGQTTNRYRLQQADIGLRIRVRVIATNAEGSASAASNPTAIVQGLTRPRNVISPTIGGSAVLGDTLTGNPGSWSGTLPISYAYQWRTCNRTGGACSSIPGATGRAYTLRQGDVGSTLRFRVTAQNTRGTETATSVPTGIAAASAPTGCPGGTGPVHVDQLAPPARLLVDRQAASPNPIPRSATNVVVRFHVSACGGRDVAGAIVYVTGVPYNQFAIPPELPTSPDGWVTLNMARGSNFPAAKNQTLLVMFVRARKGGEPLLGGISTRRLVSFRLAK